MENLVYVLESKQQFGSVKLYYQGSWQDTDDVKKAKKYSLDEAMGEARNLKKFGGHYRVIRINN